MVHSFKELADAQDMSILSNSHLHGVTLRQLPWVESSLREVLTKRHYVLRISKGD